MYKKLFILTLLVLISISYTQIVAAAEQEQVLHTIQIEPALSYQINTQKTTPYTIQIEPTTITKTEKIEIEVSNTNPLINQEVQFSASGPSDLVYEWEFGDGKSISRDDAIHAYLSPGRYTAKLTATKQLQKVAEYTLTINVRPCEGGFGCLTYKLKELGSRLKSNPAVLISIIGVVVLGILFILQSSVAKKKETQLREKLASLHKVKESFRLNKHAQAIFETLPPREQAIVNFIVDEKGKTTQARIHHNTRIPRTSLSRIIASLERKKIIETIKIGKINKIKFTGWFLGETNQ